MLNMNFADVLRDELDPDSVFQIANEARPSADYLFNSILPEMPKTSYTVKSGNMTVRTTMAGLVGKDSPYPPVGVAETSRFLAEVVKLGGHSKMTEENLIRIQEILMQLQLGGGGSKEMLAQEALNFLDKVILQAHLDRAEWLRAQALVTGAIDWTFGELNVTVDYGIPAANLLTNRTGTAAWDSTASAFWTDIRLIYEVLKYEVRAFIMHPDTALAIISNSANNLTVTAQEAFSAGGSRITVRRFLGTLERPSDDFRETISFITYGDEAEVYDTANPGQTTVVPFMPTGKILAIGNPRRRGYMVGQGSTPDPDIALALGYTHVGPTVEGGGRPGRWARLYTPEGLPMQLHGQGVSWVLPAIENPELLVVASSDLS